MAEAVLGGTGGHSPSSGLAGKVECRGPDEVNLSFLHRWCYVLGQTCCNA